MTETPAYICGRIYKILETALYGGPEGKPFEEAMEAPGRHLPRLHTKALQSGKLSAVDKDDLESLFGDIKDLPQALTPEQQSDFGLGYWHKRANVRRGVGRPSKGERQAVTVRLSQEAIANMAEQGESQSDYVDRLIREDRDRR